MRNEVKETLQYFLKIHAEKKEVAIEPVLYPIVVNLVSKDGTKVYNKAIWEELKATVEGNYDEKNPMSITH